MKTKSSIFYAMFCLSLLLGSAISIQAWTAPSSTPPAGDAPAPINVSSITQTKSGGLVTNGFRSMLDAFFDGPVKVGSSSMPSTLAIAGDICLNEVCLDAWPVSTSITCPPGEFLRGIDANGQAVCEDPTTEIEYYFGGMYGGGSSNYTNPLAGNTKACPTGYAPYKVLGRTDYDYSVWVCVGSSANVSKVAEFGGMYGYGWTSGNTYNSSTYTNPLAGNTKACPTGYTAKQVAGKTDVDYPLWYCYTTNLSIPVQQQFYGMWGGGYNPYSNPVTGNNGDSGCDAVNGVLQKRVYYSGNGSSLVDHSFLFCYKP